MLYVHSPRNQVCLCGSVSNYLDRFFSSLNTRVEGMPCSKKRPICNVINDEQLRWNVCGLLAE